jgi:WD40 repeat protein
MQLPEPWSRRTVLAIGGVTDVGFSDCGRYLLVISHSGRGLFDLASGNLVARDSAPVPESDRDDFAHTVAGFGPIEGEQVSVAGLWGGSLPQATSSGWELAQLASDAFELRGRGAQVLLHTDEEIRAIGFHPDGSILLVACSPDITIWQLDTHAA